MEPNDSDKKAISDSGPDPSAPITRKGVLTSFLTGKPMEIPEQDVVRNNFLLRHVNFHVYVVKFHQTYFPFSSVNVGLSPSLRN